jgi:hypothetical protein
MMAAKNWREELPAKVRVIKIVVAAMIASCVVFLVAALGASAAMSAFPNMEFMAYLALGVALTALVMRAVIPAKLVAAGRKQILGNLRKAADAPGAGKQTKRFEELENEAGFRLTALLQMKAILCCSILEGPVFLAIVAYFLGRSPISPAVASAMIVLLALHFPTADRASNWIEGQMQLLKEEY